MRFLLDLLTVFNDYTAELARAGRGEEVAAMRLAPAAILDLMRIAATLGRPSTTASTPPLLTTTLRRRRQRPRLTLKQKKAAARAATIAAADDHQPPPQKAAARAAIAADVDHQPPPQKKAKQDLRRDKTLHDDDLRHLLKPCSNAGDKAVCQGVGPKPRGGKGGRQAIRANTGEKAQYPVKNDRHGSHSSHANVRTSQVEQYIKLLPGTFRRMWLLGDSQFGRIKQHLLQDCRVTALRGGNISSIAAASRSATTMSAHVDVVCLGLGSVDVLKGQEKGLVGRLEKVCHMFRNLLGFTGTLVLATLPPFALHKAVIEQVNEQLREKVRTMPNVQLLDWAALLTGSPEPETCFEKDGVHVSFRGAGLLVHSLADYGLSKLGKKTAPSPKASAPEVGADNGLSTKNGQEQAVI